MGYRLAKHVYCPVCHLLIEINNLNVMECPKCNLILSPKHYRDLETGRKTIMKLLEVGYVLITKANVKKLNDQLEGKGGVTTVYEIIPFRRKYGEEN